MAPRTYRLPLTGNAVELPWHLRARFGEKPDTLVMTRGDGCITCFPWREWSKLMDRLDALEREKPGPKTRAFVQAVLAPAVKVEVDPSGRVELPPMLQACAGLQEEVEAVAVWEERRLELWAPGAYRRQFPD